MSMEGDAIFICLKATSFRHEAYDTLFSAKRRQGNFHVLIALQLGLMFEKVVKLATMFGYTCSFLTVATIT